MIINSQDIEYISLEFTERTKLSIDSKVPNSVFFWFTNFEINILKVSSENKEFCFLILFFKLSFPQILKSFWCYDNFVYEYHILEVDKSCFFELLSTNIHLFCFLIKSIKLCISKFYWIRISEKYPIILPVFCDDHRFTRDGIYYLTYIILEFSCSDSSHRKLLRYSDYI